VADNDSADKTEEPTAKRLSKARSDGEVAQSADLSSVFSITAAFISFFILAPAVWDGLLELTRSALNFANTPPGTNDMRLFMSVAGPIKSLTPLLLIVMISAAISGSLCTLSQTSFLFTTKPLTPKLSKLNPINGLKKMMGTDNWFNLGKSIAKLCVIGPIGYFTFLDFFPQLLGLMSLPINQHLSIGSAAIITSFIRIITLLLILALIDYTWQKWRMHKKLKMSKQEVKDEDKSTNGDESTKRKILAIGLQRARQRMMQDVPKADVVVTNPTHLAVALSYTGEPGQAPIVLAKGRGFVAQRIREIAKANGVPVIERKPLARALFASVEVGKEIPYELFKAVAEVLAYVYRIKGKRPKIKSTSNQSK
jgi:flagellar biosynthetic protein FlhB